MKYIDLHVHSIVSDGTYTPTELVDKAINNNLAAFALTDHDTVAGVDEAISRGNELNNEGKKIRIVPGVEISVSYNNKDIHMLGLLLDYKNETLIKALENANNERENRNKKMANNLNKAGINISLEQLRAVDPTAVITRAHFAKYLTSNGYTKSNKEAFVKYLDSDGPYYVKREYLSPETAIELIKGAGGIPILAHPLLYHYTIEELDTMVSNFKELGLLGIEALYHANTDFDEAYLKKIARKYDLLITGGSDFHGANKPLIDMGVGKGNLKIPFELLEKLDEFKWSNK